MYQKKKIIWWFCRLFFGCMQAVTLFWFESSPKNPYTKDSIGLVGMSHPTSIFSLWRTPHIWCNPICRAIHFLTNILGRYRSRKVERSPDITEEWWTSNYFVLSRIHPMMVAESLLIKILSTYSSYIDNTCSDSIKFIFRIWRLKKISLHCQQSDI